MKNGAIRKIQNTYDYMASYSPYDNIEEKQYPNLLVTAGLNDTRVSYWEPAKWVAKQRTLKHQNRILLLKTYMGAGHGGDSGRFGRLKETAMEYAFAVDTLRVEPLKGKCAIWFEPEQFIQVVRD